MEAVVSILPLLTAVAAFASRPFFHLLINQKSFSTSRAFSTAKMSDYSKPLRYVDVSISWKAVMGTVADSRPDRNQPQ